MLNKTAHIKDKVLNELFFLFKKAVESTIKSRGYWGVGTSFVYNNLELFTDDVVNKFGIQVISTQREIAATDWYVDVALTGCLQAEFDALGLNTNFSVCVESSEEYCDVFSSSEDLKLHGTWHDFSSTLPLGPDEYNSLFDEITKFTLFPKISG